MAFLHRLLEQRARRQRHGEQVGKFDVIGELVEIIPLVAQAPGEKILRVRRVHELALQEVRRSGHERAIRQRAQGRQRRDVHVRGDERLVRVPHVADHHHAFVGAGDDAVRERRRIGPGERRFHLDSKPLVRQERIGEREVVVAKTEPVPPDELALVAGASAAPDRIRDQAFELETQHDRPGVRIATDEAGLARIVKRIEVVGRVARRVDVDLLKRQRTGRTGGHATLPDEGESARRPMRAASRYKATPIRLPTSR